MSKIEIRDLGFKDICIERFLGEKKQILDKWASLFFEYLREYGSYRAPAYFEIFLLTTGFRQKKELRDWMRRSKHIAIFILAILKTFENL